MGRKAFTPEQIIFKLREVEVLVAQGESIAIACRKIAVAGVGHTGVVNNERSSVGIKKSKGYSIACCTVAVKSEQRPIPITSRQNTIT